MKKILAVVAVAAIVAFAAPAFAANPFMDVPMNHWAYDAVGQLAARGIVTGYPDGSYKGNQPITRYEMASVVARSLAVIDMDKASKQDVEMLKKLVVEFKDELDALGVKVDALDSRVAVLEENLGGWKFAGVFDFRANFYDNAARDTNFDLNKYRIFMHKTIGDKVSFHSRIDEDGTNLDWTYYWLDVALPWDVDMQVGSFNVDWQDAFGMYTDNDSVMGDHDIEGFNFTKDFSMGTAGVFVAHSEEEFVSQDYYLYGANVRFNFNEKFNMGLYAQMKAINEADVTVAGTDLNDVNTYWANAEFAFTPEISLKGAYFVQDIDTNVASFDDSPSAYKAIVAVDQDAFGFTGLWAEYLHMDKDFAPDHGDMYANYAWDALSGYYTGGYANADIDVLFVRADQKWNDTWSTFLRYVSAELDVANDWDAKNWTAGVTYNYASGLSFTLLYDDVDFGDDSGEMDDSMIRFQTKVSF